MSNHEADVTITANTRDFAEAMARVVESAAEVQAALARLCRRMNQPKPPAKWDSRSWWVSA